MSADDVITITMPRHLAGTVTNALRRASARLREQGADKTMRPSGRAMALAEAKWLNAAAQVMAEAMRNAR